MDVDEVNRVEDVLCAATLLVPICELADRHRDAQTREVRFCLLDLVCELCMRKDVVVKRLRAELHSTCDKFCLGVGVQRGEELVAPLLPLTPAVEAELRDERYYTRRLGLFRWAVHTQISACTPKPFSQAASTTLSLAWSEFELD